MMQSLKRLLPPLSSPSPITVTIRAVSLSTTTNKKKPNSSTADDDWNDAWESAWLPDEPSTVSPWEEKQSSTSSSSAVSDSAAGDGAIDADTKAFVAEMDERWTERRGAKKQQQQQHNPQQQIQHKLTSKDEYRLRKQRIHAGLWTKEIDKLEESRLGNPNNASADDIDRLLDSCSEIFDSGNIELTDSKIPSTSELKTKPDGWETTLKTQDGNIWDISQREEDILLQEFERRIAFSKFQIASFIKTHIFSRRRPIDGWKYMIEELGPNARKGKGSVQRLPSLADPSTQPLKEERPAIASNVTSFRGRRR